MLLSILNSIFLSNFSAEECVDYARSEMCWLDNFPLPTQSSFCVVMLRHVSEAAGRSLGVSLNYNDLHILTLTDHCVGMSLEFNKLFFTS